MIKLIVALDNVNTIGFSDGRLAYTGLKKDLSRFKDLTMHSTVVMGRTTYLTLGRPNGLPNRRNIVLSRRPYSQIRNQILGDVEIISSLDWAVQHDEAARRTVAGTDREPADTWIIGGAQVYDEALRLGIVDAIYLTLVHSTSEGDVRLQTDLAAWKLFLLHEERLGRHWVADVGDTEWDGSVQTTYIYLEKRRVL